MVAVVDDKRLIEAEVASEDLHECLQSWSCAQESRITVA